MARRKRGHRMAAWRKGLKAVVGIGSGVLVAGPIVLPGISALQSIMEGGKDPFARFVYEASGFNTQTNSLDNGKLTAVATRDIVLVALGLGLRWVGKRV